MQYHKFKFFIILGPKCNYSLFHEMCALFLLSLPVFVPYINEGLVGSEAYTVLRILLQNFKYKSWHGMILE